MAALIRKRNNAEKSIADLQPKYTELTKSLDPEWVTMWSEQEARALENRGEELKIYTVDKKQGGYYACYLHIITTNKSVSIAPSQAQKRLELQEAELQPGGSRGIVAWLVSGLGIEEAH